MLSNFETEAAFIRISFCGVTWLGILFVISNTCGVWSNCPGQNREADEEHNEDCVEQMVRNTRKVLGWGILVSIFEIGQNWN